MRKPYHHGAKNNKLFLYKNVELNNSNSLTLHTQSIINWININDELILYNHIFFADDSFFADDYIILKNEIRKENSCNIFTFKQNLGPLAFHRTGGFPPVPLIKTKDTCCVRHVVSSFRRNPTKRTGVFDPNNLDFITVKPQTSVESCRFVLRLYILCSLTSIRLS